MPGALVATGAAAVGLSITSEAVESMPFAADNMIKAMKAEELVEKAQAEPSPSTRPAGGGWCSFDPAFGCHADRTSTPASAPTSSLLLAPGTSRLRVALGLIESRAKPADGRRRSEIPPPTKDGDADRSFPSPARTWKNAAPSDYATSLARRRANS